MELLIHTISKNIHKFSTIANIAVDTPNFCFIIGQSGTYTYKTAQVIACYPCGWQ